MTVIAERTIEVVVKLEAETHSDVDACFAELHARIYDAIPTRRLVCVKTRSTAQATMIDRRIETPEGLL